MFKSSEDKKGFLFISCIGFWSRVSGGKPHTGELRNDRYAGKNTGTPENSLIPFIPRNDDIKYFCTVENQGHNYQVKRQRILNRIIRFFCARHLETGLGFPKTVSCTAE